MLSKVVNWSTLNCCMKILISASEKALCCWLINWRITSSCEFWQAFSALTVSIDMGQISLLSGCTAESALGTMSYLI